MVLHYNFYGCSLTLYLSFTLPTSTLTFFDCFIIIIGSRYVCISYKYLPKNVAYVHVVEAYERMARYPDYPFISFLLLLVSCHAIGLFVCFFFAYDLLTLVIDILWLIFFCRFLTTHTNSVATYTHMHLRS